MRRLLTFVFIAILLAGVLLDPYTFRESASDDIVSAPWFQTALAVVDLVLLVGIGVLAWRGRTYRALLVLAMETTFNLVIVITQVIRDGVSRFLMGASSAEYLSWYLAVIAVRVLCLAWLAHEAMTSNARAPQSRVATNYVRQEAQ